MYMMDIRLENQKAYVALEPVHPSGIGSIGMYIAMCLFIAQIFSN